MSPLFAMIGYPLGPIAVGGFLVFAIVALVLIKSGARGDAKSGASANKGPTLGCLTLICGPLVGAALAFLNCHFGEVHPLDLGYTYGVFIAMGTFAGFLGGVAFALASALAAGFLAETKQDEREH